LCIKLEINQGVYLPVAG